MTQPNSRQKQVALNVFCGLNQTEAYEKVYGPNTNNRFLASQLLTTPHVKEYLDSLNRRREAVVLANKTLETTETILTKNEKRAILAEIARARLVDFTKDGEPVLSGGTPNARAAREYYHRRRIDSNGNPIITKNIKLIDPIAAIAEDNKMSGDYAPSKHLVAQRVVFEINQVERKKRGEE